MLRGVRVGKGELDSTARAVVRALPPQAQRSPPNALNPLAHALPSHSKYTFNHSPLTGVCAPRERAMAGKTKKEAPRREERRMALIATTAG